MKVFQAKHYQYVLIHTNLGFFKVDNLGGIKRWSEAGPKHWQEVTELSSEEEAELVALGLEKFSKVYTEG